MNSDSSELDTSSNSRGIFLPPNVPLRLSSTATANSSSTSNTARQQQQQHSNTTKASLTSTDNGSGDFHLNNELNAMLAKNANGPSVAAHKPQERYVWEMRSRSPNTTPASTVLNSPDLNVDTQYTLNHHQRHHQIRVGRSPGSQFEQHTILPQGLTSPGSPTDIDKMAVNQQHLRDGEIVVFDDIDTNWMNKANANGGTAANPMLAGKMSLSMPGYQQNSDDILKVTKMIGQLPIAEYEGSPRRFGNQPTERSNGTGGQHHHQHQHPSQSMPKRPPGFPQRVSPKNPKVAGGPHRQPSELNARSHTNTEQQQQYYQQMAYNKQQQQQQVHPHYYGPSLVANANSGSNKSIGNLIDIDDDGAQHGCASANGAMGLTNKTTTPTFDYLYEFSETRKVLEEFFKANPDDEKRFADFTESGDDLGSCQGDEHEKQQQHRQHPHIEQSYIGQRLARIPKEELYMVHRSPKKQQPSCDTSVYIEHNDIELYIDSNSRSSGDLADTELEANMRRHSRNFTLSPETTDYDSNCGDLDSLSNDMNCPTDYGKLYTSMPVLEDGLSSGHASDTENNTCTMAVPAGASGGIAIHNAGDQLKSETAKSPIQVNVVEQAQYEIGEYLIEGEENSCALQEHEVLKQQQLQIDLPGTVGDGCCNNNNNTHALTSLNSCHSVYNNHADIDDHDAISRRPYDEPINYAAMTSQCAASPSSAIAIEVTSESPASHSLGSTTNPRQSCRLKPQREASDIQEAMKEIRSALQRAKVQPEKLKFCDEVLPADPDSPIWVPRTKNATSLNGHKAGSPHRDDDELDTDLETDRLLGQQRLDEHAYYDDKTIWPKTSRISGSPLQSNEQSPTNSNVGLLTSPTNSSAVRPQSFSSATIRQGIGTAVTPNSPDLCQIVGSADVTLTSPEKLQYCKSPTGSIKSLKDGPPSDKKAKARNKEGTYRLAQKTSEQS